MPNGYFTTLIAAATLFALAPQTSNAQASGDCVKTEMSNPARVVYTCGNGLVIEAEAASELTIEAPGATARPTAVSLTSDAVLVELPTGSGPFQILTPHAIASVRGTIYAVDVDGSKTSVFVVRGEVAVGASAGASAGPVTLGPGQGVEVTPGAALEVKRWPAEKAARLLARFGR